jgi:outer membrane beta-barrel protein
MKKTELTFALTSLLALAAAPALAQDSEPAADAADRDNTGAPISYPGQVDAGFARVTDDEETIYAVQRKAYLIKNKTEVSLMFTALFNDRYVQSYAPVGSIVYHLSENFGLEAYGGYLFPDESGATTELFERGGFRPPFALLTQLLWAGGLGVQWSPVYGKIEIGGQELGNFSFYLTAGVAVGQTRVECTANGLLDPAQFGEGSTCEEPSDPEDQVYEPATFRPMGMFGGGLNFYLNDRFGLKAEVRDFLFSSRVFRPDEAGQLFFSDAIRNNVYASIGVSVLFGGGEN